MSDDDRDAHLARAAGLRRTVAETIARVRRKTAHIGTSLPPADDDEPAESEGAGREPEAASAAPPPAGSEGVAREGDTDRSDDGGRGLGGDVGALLERTRAVIERTRRMIDESRATVTRFHHPERDDGEAGDQTRDEEDERGGSPSA